jgi:hypothetical protein
MQPLTAPALLVLTGLLNVAHVASAQSIDRARQLFHDARYAEAKTELIALQQANAVVKARCSSSSKRRPPMPTSRRSPAPTITSAGSPRDAARKPTRVCTTRRR